jgi:hypothetical protein
MEEQAITLRARAELAKLDAEHAESVNERSVLIDRARAFEAQARALEDILDGCSYSGHGGLAI